MRLGNVLALGAAVALVGTGVAVATASADEDAVPYAVTSGPAPAPAAMISACVDRRTGDVRIFRNGKCREDEKVVRLNSGRGSTAGGRGPQGPAGPAGPSAGLVYEPAPVTVVEGAAAVTVLTAPDIPGGQYVMNFSASVYAMNGAPGGTVRCVVEFGEYEVAISTVSGLFQSGQVAMTGGFLSSVAPSGSDLQVNCSSIAGDMSVEKATLSLIRVGELSIITDDPCRRTDTSLLGRC